MPPFRKRAVRVRLAVLPLAAALAAAPAVPAAAHTTGADTLLAAGPAQPAGARTPATRPVTVPAASAPTPGAGTPAAATADHTTGADTPAAPAATPQAGEATSAVPAATADQSLDCAPWIRGNDPLTGGVDCLNRSAGPVTFHADIACGTAPDVTGDSVTVQPGAVGESSGRCAFYSTGIGAITWTVE